MKLTEKVLAKKINRLLWNKGKTVATAESCSCGRLATILSECPGSSEYFKGGVVCYTDEMKTRHLGVSADLLARKTAVCEEVAIAMVEGATKMFSSDYAVSMTGVAGPGGATADNPVGSIWVAYGKKGDVKTFHQLGDNGRDVNVETAVNKLMSLFLEYLREELEKD